MITPTQLRKIADDMESCETVQAGLRDGANTIESLTQQLAEIQSVMLAHADDTEATATPFWYIAQKGGLGRQVLLRGIWFSREAAETHLRNKAHRYPPKAFVYCDSGCDSVHLKRMYAVVRALPPTDLTTKEQGS